MNAPAPHIAADPLAALLPGRDEDEMGLRRRIAKARDLSAARMVTLKGIAAADLNHMLNEAANAWLYAPASLDRLQDQVNFLLRLAMLAGHAERLETHP
jgi:hypothetical protein